MNRAMITVYTKDYGTKGQTILMVHEPTGKQVEGMCYNEDIDELKDALFEELTAEINTVKNWLH